MDDMEVELPYSMQERWANVSPLHVDDGNCVVAVQYTAEHREALSYFRAILAAGEKSVRALDLSAHMIRLNQADYTAWQHRWLCVEALKSDLEAEYELTESIMQDNAKNYQLWNHRRKCALKAGPSAAQREIEFAAAALDIDEKNYHAWAHRMMIVQAFGLWHDELDYVEQMIERDVRNNSAWNQRAFVFKRMLEDGIPGGDLAADAHPGAAEAEAGAAPGNSRTVRRPALEAIISRELDYVSSMINLAPRNESCWSYLLGLFSLPGCRKLELAYWPRVHAICIDALARAPSCPPALAMLAECYACVAEARAGHASAQISPETGCEASTHALQSAVSNANTLWEGLLVADPVRSMYWLHRQRALKHLLEVAVPVTS